MVGDLVGFNNYGILKLLLTISLEISSKLRINGYPVEDIK